MNKLFPEYELLDYIQCILESETIDESSQKLRMIIKLIKKTGYENYD